MILELEFNIELGYTKTINKQILVLEDYLDQPVIRWCHEKVGPIVWPKDVNEILRGDGWEISADWTKWMHNRSTKPRVCVIIKKDIDPQLVTEFWMRFQQ